jgi:hypothetical protein
VPDAADPLLWVVAGCLFEVSLPEGAGGPWRWPDPPAHITLLAEGVRDGRRHLRFRAEAAGEVELRFSRPGSELVVTVRIAPEVDLASPNASPTPFKSDGAVVDT